MILSGASEKDIKEWEKEYNSIDPAYCSDYDEYDFRRKPIQISILGRRNVGKSTFINSVLKEKRC